MADDKTQVLIELKLQVKELKKQMEESKDQFKELKKSIEGAVGGKHFKEMIKALNDLTRAQKQAARSFAAEEKKKEKAAESTTDALKKQSKEANRALGVLKKMNVGGRFMGGLGAGLGLGAGKQAVTARGAGAMLGRGLSAGIGGAAQFFMSGISSAYQQYLSYGQAVGGLVGMGTPGQMKAARRAGGGVGGAGLGYSVIETAQQAQGIGRATGNIGAVYRGQQFGRAYGMGVGEAGGYMGMVRQAGYGFGGMRKDVLTGQRQQVDQRGSRELKKIMEAGLMSGIEKARLPEFLQGVSQITQQVGGRISGDVNVGGIAQFQAMLGRTGKSGFQGARGAAVAAQLGQAITRPGGGEAGQAMMLQALGFGKPGGERSYYDAMKMQQQGLERPESVLDMFNEVYSQLGQKGAGGTASVNQEANLALSEMTGLSLDQVETMGDLINSGLSQEELLKEIKEETAKAEPVEKQALKAMKEGFGGTVAYLAGITDRQVALGGQFADQFAMMQKMQLKALEVMAKHLPKIVDWLKEAWLALKDIISIAALDMTGEKRKLYEAERKKTRKELTDIFGEEAQGDTLQKRMAANKEAQAKLRGEIKKLKAYDPGKGGTGGGIVADAANLLAWSIGTGETEEVWKQNQRNIRDKELQLKRFQGAGRALSDIKNVVGRGKLGPQGRRLASMASGSSHYGRGYSQEVMRKVRRAAIAEQLAAKQDAPQPVGNTIQQRLAAAQETRLKGSRLNVRKPPSQSTGPAGK